ncbi:MAG: hypothetical protein ACYDHY_17520 [Acidiferrobacterales bacterium]
MSIVTAERPAVVPGRKPARRAARAVEVRMRRTAAGEWLIERESESQPGLAYLIRVGTDGAAAHEYAPGAPSPVCTANEYSRHCRHLDQAAALVEIGEEIVTSLLCIADERRAWEGTVSRERVWRWRWEAQAAADSAAALGCRLVKVTDEGWAR